MKKFQSIVLNSCFYTVLISIVILAITTLMSESGNLGISFTRYLVFFACGIAISLANFIFKLRTVHVAIRLALHYFALLAAFLIIFTTDGVLKLERISHFFVAVVVYSILYSVIFMIMYFIKRAMDKIESKSKKTGKNQATTKQKYESRFK